MTHLLILNSPLGREPQHHDKNSSDTTITTLGNYPSAYFLLKNRKRCWGGRVGESKCRDKNVKTGVILQVWTDRRLQRPEAPSVFIVILLPDLCLSHTHNPKQHRSFPEDRFNVEFTEKNMR